MHNPLSVNDGLCYPHIIHDTAPNLAQVAGSLAVMVDTAGLAESDRVLIQGIIS